MLAEAHAASPHVAETFAQASEVLGYDLWACASEGPQERINLTEVTQPLLLTASVALWRCWLAADGPAPAYMAGHSLGEFSALVCAGSIDFGDGVRLVQARGRFMQEAVPVGVGAMAAVIGLDDASIVTICGEIAGATGECVAAVNFNSPGQVVIAGHAGAVAQAGEALKAAGAKRVLPLPVSAPFHTELMRPAGDRLAEILGNMTIRAPRLPVVHNVNASTESDPAKIRALLIQQIYSPVRWTECVAALAGAGIARFAECGPGKVLGGLIGRTLSDAQVFPLEDPGSLQGAINSLS